MTSEYQTGIPTYSTFEIQILKRPTLGCFLILGVLYLDPGFMSISFIRLVISVDAFIK